MCLSRKPAKHPIDPIFRFQVFGLFCGFVGFKLRVWAKSKSLVSGIGVQVFILCTVQIWMRLESMLYEKAD